MAVGVVVAILSEEMLQKDIKLRESQDKFRSVANSAVDGIITTDNNGKIVLFNPSLENMFGYGIDEIKGKHATILMPDKMCIRDRVQGNLQTSNQTMSS